MAARPQKCAGIRMLPPASVPRPSGEPQAETIADSPPLEPPGVRACEIIRIIGAAIDEIVRLDRAGQFRHIGLAENDGARGAQPRHRRCIRFWHVVRPALGAAGADDAGRFQRILDRHRHAMQRSFDLAARQRRIGFVCLFSRRLGRQLNDGVELGVDRCDPLQMCIHDRFGAELFGANGVRELCRRFRGDVIVHARCCLRCADQGCASCGCDDARGRGCAQKIPSSPFIAHVRPALPATFGLPQLIRFRSRMQVPGQHGTAQGSGGCAIDD
jgi:hypothetical protein